MVALVKGSMQMMHWRWPILRGPREAEVVVVEDCWAVMAWVSWVWRRLSSAVVWWVRSTSSICPAGDDVVVVGLVLGRLFAPRLLLWL